MSNTTKGPPKNRLTASSIPGVLYLSGLGIGIGTMLTATASGSELLGAATAAHLLSLTGLAALYARHRDDELKSLLACALGARIAFALAAVISLGGAIANDITPVIAMLAVPIEVLCLSVAMGRRCSANGHSKMGKLLRYNAGLFALSDAMAISAFLTLGILGMPSVHWLAILYIVGLYGLLTTAIVYMAAMSYATLRVRA
jgi:hypothetical protein